MVGQPGLFALEKALRELPAKGNRSSRPTPYFPSHRLVSVERHDFGRHDFRGEGVLIAGNCGTPERRNHRRAPTVPLFHCCKRVRGAVLGFASLAPVGRAGPNSKNCTDFGRAIPT
jgi:hypothetical protein